MAEVKDKLVTVEGLKAGIDSLYTKGEIDRLLDGKASNGAGVGYRTVVDGADFDTGRKVITTTASTDVAECPVLVFTALVGDDFGPSVFVPTSLFTSGKSVRLDVLSGGSAYSVDVAYKSATTMEVHGGLSGKLWVFSPFNAD